jgi:hypothetical protein
VPISINHERIPRNPQPPIYDDPAYASKLSIHHNVSPADVYEVSTSDTNESSHFRYIALTDSDQSLTYIPSVHSHISIHLPRVNDFEIITYARIYSLSQHFNSPLFEENMWFAVIGANKLYNPGGAVRGIELNNFPLEQENDTIKIALHLLGTGKFLIITSGNVSDVSVISARHFSASNSGVKVQVDRAVSKLIKSAEAEVSVHIKEVILSIEAAHEDGSNGAFVELGFKK